MLLFFTLFFAAGAIVASFVGVLYGRLHTGQSIVSGRSHCDLCGQLLSIFALVPIVSYLVSFGRARCCGARISARSPLSEFLLGILFALSYAKLGFSFALPFVLIALAALLALVLYDLAHQVLPPSFLGVFLVSSTVASLLQAASLYAFGVALITAGLISLSLGLLHVFSRGRAIGLADAPLSFGLALFAGSAALPGFVFSFWIGALVGIVVLARRPRGSRMGVEVPFAPFLAAGFLLAYFISWNPFILIAACRNRRERNPLSL